MASVAMAYPSDVRNLPDLYNVFRDAPNRQSLINEIRNGLVDLRNASELLAKIELSDKIAITNLNSMLSSLALGVEKTTTELKKFNTTNMNRATVLADYQKAIINIETSTLLMTTFLKQLSIDASGIIIGSIYPILPAPVYEDLNLVLSGTTPRFKNVFDDRHNQFIVVQVSPAALIYDFNQDSVVSYVYNGVTIFTSTFSSKDRKISIVNMDGSRSSSNVSLNTSAFNPTDMAPMVYAMRYVKNGDQCEVYYFDASTIIKFINYSGSYDSAESLFTQNSPMGIISGNISGSKQVVTGIPYLDVKFTFSPTLSDASIQIVSIYNNGIIDMLKYLTETETEQLNIEKTLAINAEFTKSDLMTSSLITMQSNISALMAATPRMVTETVTFQTGIIKSAGDILTIDNNLNSQSVITNSLIGYNDLYKNGVIQGSSTFVATLVSLANIESSSFHNGSTAISGAGQNATRTMTINITIPNMLDSKYTTIDSLYYNSASDTIIPYSVQRPNAYPWVTISNMQYSVSPLAHNMTNAVMAIDKQGIQCFKVASNLAVYINMTIDVDDASASLGGEIINDFVFSITLGDQTTNFTTAFKSIVWTDTAGRTKLKLVSSVNILDLFPVDAIYYVISISSDGSYSRTDRTSLPNTDWNTTVTQTIGNYTYATPKAYWDNTTISIKQYGAATYNVPSQDYTKISNTSALIADYNTASNVMIVANSRIYYNGTPMYFKIPDGVTIRHSYFSSPLKNPIVDTYNATVSRNASYLVRLATRIDSVDSLVHNLQARIEAMVRAMEPSRTQQMAGIISGVGGAISLAMPLLGAVVVTIGTALSLADPDKHGIDYQAVFNAFTSWCQFAIICRYKYGIMTNNDPKLDVLNFMPNEAINNFVNKPTKIYLPELDKTVTRGTSTDYIDTGVNVRYNDMLLLGEGKMADWLNKTVNKVENNTANFYERNLVNILKNKNVLPMHARVEIIQTEKIGDIYRQTILYTGINEGAYLDGNVYMMRSGNKYIQPKNDFTSGPGRFKAVLESSDSSTGFKPVDWTLSGMTSKEIYAASGTSYPDKNPAHKDVQLLYETIINDFSDIDNTYVLKHHNTMMLPGQMEALEQLLVSSAKNFKYALIGSNCQNYSDDLVNLVVNFKKPKRWVEESDFKQYIQSIYDDL
ncbi:RNA-binding protein [Scaphoideus titanus reo-like virus 1]|nr:RNA-binding protein [Scaphoideus titanus reo-like virus 1]